MSVFSPGAPISNLVSIQNPGNSGMLGTQGINLQGAVWGSTIPVSAGFRRVDGVVLWAGDEVKTNIRSTYTPSILGSLAVTDTTWEVTRPFAVSLGERLNPDDPPPVIRRIWVDGVLAYANGESTPINWDNLQGAYLLEGQWIDGVWVPNNPGAPPLVQNAPVFGNGVAIPANPVQSNISFRFYDGSEDQVADTEVGASLGDLAPAYRGLMYLVIDGLKFGTGSATDVNLSSYGGTDAVTNGQIVHNNFPAISVELVDDATITVQNNFFRMIDDAVPFTHFVVPASNFSTRQLVSIQASPDGNGGYLNVFDMDDATQSTQTFIDVTSLGDGPQTVGIGGLGSVMAWDYVNNHYFTAIASYSFCSVGADGTLIDAAFDPNHNLAPKAADGMTITDANPAVAFPQLNQAGMVDYIVRGGELWPCLFAGTNSTAQNVGAFIANDDGTLPHTLGPGGFLINTIVGSIVALRLFDKAISQDHLSYQDAAYVMAHQNGVDLVYITGSSVAGKRKPNIIARQTIYSRRQATANTAIVALVDGDGNVVVQEIIPGLGQYWVTKIRLKYTSAPDFSIAPGWRGNFVQLDAQAYELMSTTAQAAWNAQGVQYSDFTGNTYAQGGDVWDLTNGTVTPDADFDGSGVWDSSRQLLYYPGNVVDPTQVFTGGGMLWTQIFTGLNGHINDLADMLRDLAHFAGFDDSHLDVDSALTDEIPGVLILQPYDLATMFNDIGALYGFTYVNTGGVLKFASSTNDPIKATGKWTITGAVAGGNTVTIGTSTYTFRTTPAAPFDVKIGTNDVSDGVTVLNAKEKTASNLLAAITGNLLLGAADSQDPLNNPAFFAGTVANKQVVAVADKDSTDQYGFTSIILTAVVGGASGNSIATTFVGGAQNFSSHTTLLNGSEPTPPVLTLTKDDMAYVEENQLTQFDSIVTTIAPPTQGQQAAAVNYYALEQNYALTQQTYIPDNLGGTTSSVGTATVVYNIPFVMSTTEAYARVSRTALQQGENIITQNFRLPQEYLLLEPSDVIAVQIPPYEYQVRLDEVTFNGDWSTSFSAINYSFRTDVAINTSDATGTIPQSVPTGSDCLPVVIDAPLRDPGFGSIAGVADLFDGVRALTTRFGQGVLNAALVTDGKAGAAATIMTTSKDVRWGTLTSAMPAAVRPYYRTVEQSLDLSCKTIQATDLASASYQDFVAGKNCLAIGQPGNWEYVFFRDVEQLSPKAFRLTGLVRAQRGTDAAVVHSESDYVLLLASVAPGFQADILTTQSITSDLVGDTYRFTSSGVPSTKPAGTEDVTVEGLTLYPFSPCLPKVTLGVGNVLAISWVRRDRLGTEFVTNAQPMSEASEKYDLEIMDGSGVVKRTATDLTTNSYSYSSANQTTDGLTPGSVTTLQIALYQKGILGRGFKKMETVNVR